MGLFQRKRQSEEPVSCTGTPVIRCSICTGEQVAGFRNPETGRFEEVMLLKTEKDLEDFRKKYGITGEIARIY